MVSSRSGRRTSLLLAALLTFGLAPGASPTPADAAVVCQKRKKVRLRTTACKAKEVTVADLGTDVSGIWQHRQGSGLASGSFLPTFLTLNADGTGVLNRREASSQVLSCRTLRYAQGAGRPTLTLQLTGSSTGVVLAALDGGDVLRITDDEGTSEFDRVGAVDPATECGTLAETSRLAGVPPPFGGSVGLAFDGTNFVYVDDEFSPVTVNAATGLLGIPPTLVSLGRIPHASEGGDVWGLCGCGGNDVAVRSSTSGTEVDEVDTSELGGRTSIRALAVPAPGQLLLLVSDGGSTFSGRLLLVNTAAEPDVLLSEVDFDVSLGSMAVDGASLWGLSGGGQNATVVRVNPATGLATGTFLIPDTSVRWRALTASGGKLFLAGVASDGSGVIATFDQP